MTADDGNRVLTLPNAVSASRLLGVPFFYWSIVSHRFALALALLVYAGFSDWADGQLARRLHQYSRLGENLDPLADRLYIASTLIGLAVVAVIPLWLVVAVMARDICMLGYLAWLRRRGILGVPVHYVGKAATMLLLYSFPIFILGQAFPSLFQVTRAFGWAFGLWGVGMYWYAALLYWWQRGEIEA